MYNGMLNPDEVWVYSVVHTAKFTTIICSASAIPSDAANVFQGLGLHVRAPLELDIEAVRR